MFPKQVYAIYPRDEQGNVAGVYVGSANDVNARFIGHMADHKCQKELHDMMRHNGFTFQILGVENGYDETHLEYDWVDFFKKSGAHVFNQFIKGGNADVVCSGFSKPIWNGQGVVWEVKPREKKNRRPFTDFVREHGMTLWEVSSKLGMSTSLIYQRLYGEYSFTDEEVAVLKSLFPDTPESVIDQFINAKYTTLEVDTSNFPAE